MVIRYKPLPRNAGNRERLELIGYTYRAKMPPISILMGQVRKQP